MKAAIYPLKEVSIKIKHQYGKKSILMYMRIVNFALEQVSEKTFKEEMEKKLADQANSTHFIKTILEEINSNP